MNTKALQFIILTFLLSWTLAAAMWFRGINLNSPEGLVMTLMYMCIPAISTIIVQRFLYKEKLVDPLQIKFKMTPWFWVAWLLPLLLAGITFGISLALPDVQFSTSLDSFIERIKVAGELSDEQVTEFKGQLSQIPPILVILVTAIQALLVGISVNAVAALGEELGWRGLLQKELNVGGFWKSSLLIGCIWGLWHAPIIAMGHNYPDHPMIGIGMMILWCMSMAPTIGYIRLKAQSVIAAAIFHGTINAVYGITIMYLTGGNDLLIGFSGAAGILAFSFVSIALFLYDRGQLAKQKV